MHIYYVSLCKMCLLVFSSPNIDIYFLSLTKQCYSVVISVTVSCKLLILGWYRKQFVSLRQPINGERQDSFAIIFKWCDRATFFSLVFKPYLPNDYPVVRMRTLQFNTLYQLWKQKLSIEILGSYSAVKKSDWTNSVLCIVSWFFI